jgi:hypothetical protein
MLNKENNPAEQTRYEFVKSKTDLIKAKDGKNYAVHSDNAVTELLDELPKDWKPNDVKETLHDLQNYLKSIDPGDISAKQFVGYLIALDLSEHYFQNLLTKQFPD